MNKQLTLLLLGIFFFSFASATITVHSPSSTESSSPVLFNLSSDQDVTAWGYAFEGFDEYIYVDINDNDSQFYFYPPQNNNNTVKIFTDSSPSEEYLNITFNFTGSVLQPTGSLNLPTVTNPLSSLYVDYATFRFYNYSLPLNNTPLYYSIDGGATNHSLTAEVLFETETVLQIITEEFTIESFTGTVDFVVYADLPSPYSTTISDTVQLTYNPIQANLSFENFPNASGDGVYYDNPLQPLNVSSDRPIDTWVYSLDGGANNNSFSGVANISFAEYFYDEVDLWVWATNENGTVSINKTFTYDDRIELQLNLPIGFEQNSSPIHFNISFVAKDETEYIDYDNTGYGFWTETDGRETRYWSDGAEPDMLANTSFKWRYYPLENKVYNFSFGVHTDTFEKDPKFRPVFVEVNFTGEVLPPYWRMYTIGATVWPNNSAWNKIGLRGVGIEDGNDIADWTFIWSWDSDPETNYTIPLADYSFTTLYDAVFYNFNPTTNFDLHTSSQFTTESSDVNDYIFNFTLWAIAPPKYDNYTQIVKNDEFNTSYFFWFQLPILTRDSPDYDPVDEFLCDLLGQFIPSYCEETVYTYNYTPILWNITTVNEVPILDTIIYSYDGGVTNYTGTNGEASLYLLQNGTNNITYWVTQKNFQEIVLEFPLVINYTGTEIILPPTPPEQPAHLSSPLFLTLRGFGAGLGVFFQMLALALPILLVGLGIVGFIVLIGYALGGVMPRHYKQIFTRK